MPSALSGLTVVDLSWGFTGAIVTMLLADYGAEVIKVEPPGGDAIRRHPAFYMWQRGKKSIALDLKQPSDLDRARRLASNADLVLETFRPGVAKRLGLDYESLIHDNPPLIHVSVTGFGTKGSLTDLKAYEGIATARMGGFGKNSSMAPRQGPSFAAVPWSSFSGAQTALQGLLAALYVRERTGQGQHVETSLMQGLVAQDPWNQFIHWLSKKYPEAYVVTAAVPPTGATPLTDYIFRMFVAMTKDGRWVQFSQTSPHLWKALERGLGIEQEIARDPAFKNAPVMETYEDSVRFWEMLLKIMRSKTLAEWESHFQQHPDVGMEPFRSPQEAMAHPQFVHNRHALEIADPRVGKTVQLAPMVHMPATPGKVQRHAPDVGEHTAQVLKALERGIGRPSSSTRSAQLPRYPLEGVTVVELGLFYAAPFGVTCLADLGARIIKLEQLRGDDMRNSMAIPETAGVKVLQGKESVAVDLETERGREIAHRIIAKADLLMMSFRGGVAKRLGVDYPTLKRINPRLVYLNAPGYGTDGPYARKPAYAPSIGAAVGTAITQVGVDSLPRNYESLTLDQIKAFSLRLRSAASGPGNADGVSSLAVGTSLLLGLLARERTGIAQEMFTSMPGLTAHANSAEMIAYEGKPPSPQPDPMLYGFGPLYRLYQASDGWIFLACVTESEWHSLCSALATRSVRPEPVEGRTVADLAGNPRFVNADSRRNHGDALAETLSAIFKTREAAEWERDLRAVDVACVEVPPYPIYYFAMEDPAMRENGFLAEVDHPTFGTHPRLAPLASFSKTPGLARPACTIGQHTEAVLREFGYSDAAIRNLEAQHVIRCADTDG